MSESPPDLLHIDVEKEDEVYADRMDLHVSVKGSSLVSGVAALKRAKEVNQLVEALLEVGVGEDNVFVQSVHAEVQSGLLTTSSSAEYELRIRVMDLSRVAEVVEAIGTRKNVTIQGTEWHYESLEETLGGWLQGLLAQANAKAEMVARLLGVKILGVHHFSEQRWETDRPRPGAPTLDLAPAMADAPVMRARGGPGAALGFDVAHAKSVRLVASVHYRVGPRG